MEKEKSRHCLLLAPSPNTHENIKKIIENESKREWKKKARKIKTKKWKQRERKIYPNTVKKNPRNTGARTN